MKIIKILVRDFFFLLGMALIIWSLVILIGGISSKFREEVTSELSFGILKLQIFEGNEQLAIIFFIAVIVLGVFTMFLSKR